MWEKIDYGLSSKSSMLRKLSELGLLCPYSLGTQNMMIPVRRRQRWCEYKEAGQMWARLTANPNKPVVPTVLLASVILLDSKLDYIRLSRASQRSLRDCCIFTFTETWLCRNIRRRSGAGRADSAQS